MRYDNSIFKLLPALLLLCLTATPSLAGEKPIIHFGVIPRYNPMIMYQNYQPIMDYLTRTTLYRFELKLARDYPQVVEHLRTGVTQVASLGDVTFAAASQGFGARPILRPRNQQGQPDYYSLIVVRKESPLTNVAQLKGKSFAFGNIHSTSGNLIPRNYLFEHGVELTDLGRYENLPTHTDVALAVLKGQFDAGAVKDVVAYRYQKSGLRVLARSAPIPSVPIVVRRDAPQELVAALSKALLAIDPVDPQHKKMLANWDPEFRNGFVPASTEDYRPILQMLENISGGCGKLCHPQ
jgi:phosphonate transport system substrate-binding protein